jgi:hypothetical protein
MADDAAMEISERLATAVAEAADAWLRDPRDVTIYQHLVDATLRWRAHTQPQLQLPALAEPEPELEATADDVEVSMPGTLADGIRDLAAQLKR